MTRPHRYRRGQIEDDCIHLLHCVASGKCTPPQSYAKLARETDIPKVTVWKIVNEYREILKSVAHKYNYRLRIVNCEDCIIDVVYDGPIRKE